MLSDSFFDQFRSMSFGKLREYIDSCLSGVNSDHANPLRTKEEFLQLCDILRVKAVEPLVLPKLRQETKVPLLPDEPPPFPAFKPSERLIGLERELGVLQMQLSLPSGEFGILQALQGTARDMEERETTI
jgi:hypothetical protein